MRFYATLTHAPESCPGPRGEARRLLIGPLGPKTLVSSLSRQYSVKWLIPSTSSLIRKITPSYTNYSLPSKG